MAFNNEFARTVQLQHSLSALARTLLLFKQNLQIFWTEPSCCELRDLLATACFILATNSLERRASQTAKHFDYRKIGRIFAKNRVAPDPPKAYKRIDRKASRWHFVQTNHRRFSGLKGGGTEAGGCRAFLACV
jgi:hypothetical protein